MGEDFVTQVLYNGVMTTLMMSLPIIGVGLIVGFIISLFQAVTQIQEQTLTFVPKLIAVLLMIVVTAPWMFSILMSFTSSLWANIPAMAR
ncbi:MAG: flagellar biosynthesis protein FliQ [Candidatus Saganbacteria bacterium]|nr:flagellar biosynthesis protein FliQ [Candidatus Saganbacteria bacterium]